MTIFSSYPSPVAIGAIAAGLLFASAILLGIYQGRRVIGAQIKKAGEALFSQIGFFTIVILVFLVISVLESGEFFNVNITHQALFGTLGYALALGFDLVSVACMLARMGALRMRDERGARLNLLGVILCAAVSAFANAAASLQGYQASNLDHTPWWMQQVAPWLGTIFPTMIVVLSLTTDHLLDHRAPTKEINLATYKEQEKRRVDMVRIKLATEKELLTLDREITDLRIQRGQASGQLPREWFFARWMRPVIPPTQEQITEQLEQALDSTRTTLDTQVSQLQTLLTTVATRLDQLASQTTRHDEALDTFREQMASLTTLMATMTADLATLDGKVSTLTTRMETTSVQMDTRNAAVHQRSSPERGQVSVQQGLTSSEGSDPRLTRRRTRHPRQTISLDTVRQEQNDTQEAGAEGKADLDKRILVVHQMLGPHASNRQIAQIGRASCRERV